MLQIRGHVTAFSIPFFLIFSFFLYIFTRRPRWFTERHWPIIIKRNKSITCVIDGNRWRTSMDTAILRFFKDFSSFSVLFWFECDISPIWQLRSNFNTEMIEFNKRNSLSPASYANLQAHLIESRDLHFNLNNLRNGKNRNRTLASSLFVAWLPRDPVSIWTLLTW